jgi:predicted amidophosphoribosyltransferase
MALQIQHLEFNSEKFTHYYLCQYRPLAVGLDDLSRSLLNFKCGRQLDVEAWTECSVSELKQLRIKNNCLILRVLNSTEKVIDHTSDTPLDHLGNQISKNSNAAYMPHLLKKVRVTSQVKFLSLAERKAELSDVYVLDKLNFDVPSEVLILDDIITTGTTVRSVIRAVRSVWRSCPVQIFTLASTDYHAKLNTSVQLNSYAYTWELEKGWKVAEDESIYSSELASLKSKILSDFS